jgi:gentisate 1,2-dioxygenase
MSRGGDIDACHGYRMRYVNPVTGEWAMPTIGAAMQLLPRGFSAMPYRSTDSTVFVVVEGRGRTVIDGETFDWGPHDIFVAPSWRPYRHDAAEEAVLFSFSDRPVHEKLGLWRELRAKA